MDKDTNLPTIGLPHAQRMQKGATDEVRHTQTHTLTKHISNTHFMELPLDILIRMYEHIHAHGT